MDQLRSFGRKKRGLRMTYGSGPLWEIGQRSVFQSHFAIVQKSGADQNDAEWPEAGHDASRLVFGRKAEFEPARPTGHDSEDR